MEIKIAPSILSADFSRLADDIAKVEDLADLLHIDVMDGHFVPNISIGTPIVESVKKITKLPLDVHLMVSNPEKVVEEFANAGSDIITVHVEAIKSGEIFDKIHELGKKAGISLNPDTPLEEIEPYLDKVEMVVVMSVNPGFGGQGFIDVTEKIKNLRAKYKGDIQADGGIKDENAKKVVDAGANVLVAGSFIFKAENPAEAVKQLREAVNG